MTEPGVASAAGAGERRPPDVDDRGEERIRRAVESFQLGRDREAAFRVLYETYFPALLRFFARKGFDPDERLDLTQETFLRVYKGLNGYEHRRRFAGWLYTVAKTTHLKRRRRAAAAKRSAIEVSRDAMPHPDPTLAVPERQLDGMLDDERRRALRAAVDELPEQMRDCLMLRLYHQLTYREIATVKKLSTETVKAHLFRARKKLEERLGSDPTGGLEDDL